MLPFALPAGATSATSHATRSHALLSGPPVASDQLLPNEVWSRIHALLELRASHALTCVDINLRSFALPTAKAHLSAALLPRKRHEHGTRLVRRAVAALHHEFEDSRARDRHVQQLVVLAAEIGPHWSDRNSFGIVQTALCDVLPDLPPALARHVLSNLAAMNQRGCASLADPAGISLGCRRTMSIWRSDLKCRHDQLRAADIAAHGVLGEENWQRLERRMAEFLGSV